MRRGSARGACTIAARELRPKASRPSSSTAKLRLLLNTRGNGCAGSRPIGVSTGRSSRKKYSRIHCRCAGFHSSRRGKTRSEEHTSELQSRLHLVCRLLLEKKKKNSKSHGTSY